jgi:hypothetical protein
VSRFCKELVGSSWAKVIGCKETFFIKEKEDGGLKNPKKGSLGKLIVLLSKSDAWPIQYGCRRKRLEMERDGRQNDYLETTPFLESEQNAEESKPSVARKFLNRFFGAFVSVTIGVYAGLISRTMQEAWIYAALFSAECLVCACIAAVIKTHSFRKSIASFAVYFLVSALFAPVSCWFWFRFGW